MPITENDLSAVYDGDVLSASGEKIGSVGQIYLDDQTGAPTFVTVNTGLFGLTQSFVPLRGARVENGDVIVDFDKTTVKDAPRIDDDGSLSPAEEDQLYAYYGMGPAIVDTADYGTAGQTPEPGSARAGGNAGTGSPDGQENDLGDDRSPGGRDVRSDEWGDRPVRANEHVAAAGPPSDGTDDQTTPAAPPAGGDPARSEPDAARSPTEETAVPAGRGRLRRWARTEDQPVAREQGYVEGSGQPGERPTQ